MSLALQLRNGIYLEGSKQLLRWGCTRGEAWQISGATHYLPNDVTRIQWQDNIFGLRCGLLAYLPQDSKFDFATIWMRLPENTYPNGALYQYCKFFDQLFGDYGNPHIRASGDFYAPILTWEHHGCFLQLYTGERMGDFTTLEISHGLH